MNKKFFSLVVIVGIMSFSCTVFASNNTLTAKNEANMTNHNGVSITKVTLIAREEKQPSVGQSPKSDRDIGFATVFLNIENAKQENVKLVIEKIQIQDTIDSSVQLVKDTAEEIHLKSLENSVNDFRLTNKIGYPTKGQVKAVVTYSIGGQVQEIQSTVVSVDRF